MSSVVWEDPPPSRRGKTPGRHQRLCEELKTRPGTWAVFGQYCSRSSATSTANALRRSRGGEGFEFVTRNRTVYGRYVGEAE